MEQVLTDKENRLINVVIADDHELVRQGIRTAFDSADDITVLAEASNGLEALNQARELKPDVLILDVEMPRMTGVEVARELSRAGDDIHILALSAFDDREYVYGLVDSGAAGYLMKEEANSETLCDAVRSIVETDGEFWISPVFAAKLVKFHLDERRTTLILQKLSDRETEILGWVGRGGNNSSIAKDLFLSAHTIKNHVEHIKRKVGVATRAELIAWAWKNGQVK